MALRIAQLEAAAAKTSSAAAPVSPTSSSGSSDPALALDLANLFNGDIVSVASFVRDRCAASVSLVSPSMETQGRDMLVKLFVGLQAQFPNSKLNVTKTDSSTGVHDVAFNLEGMLSNGRPLLLPGHFFVTTAKGPKGDHITKVIGVWNETSVLAQQFGMELSEWKKKADGASFFEDFWL